MTKNKTPEITDEHRVEYATGQRESIVFLRRNPDYVANKRNAETMLRELKKKGLEWTTENLQSIWESVDRGLFDLTEDLRPKAKEPLPPIVVEEKREIFPWGAVLEGEEGKDRVRAMDGSQLRRYMGDRKTGHIFKQQLEALQMTRADLRKGEF